MVERDNIVKKLFIRYYEKTNVYVYGMFRNVICEENNRNTLFLYLAEEGERETSELL
jgi:hypothetical protein